MSQENLPLLADSPESDPGKKNLTEEDIDLHMPIDSVLSSGDRVRSIDLNSANVHGIKNQGDGMSYKQIAWVMLSDIVGTSVLSFPGVAAHLGWFWTVLLVLVGFPISFYVAVLMQNTRSRIVAMSSENLSLGSMGEIARHTIGMSRIVYFLVYGMTLLGQPSYIVVLGDSLQSVLPVGWCIPTCMGIGCLCLAPMVSSVKRLRDSVTLCFINLLLLVFVVLIFAWSMIETGGSKCAKRYMHPPGLTFFTVFTSATNIVYSYAGMWMYFEMMDEMKRPTDFTKAFAITGPVTLCIYLFVACFGYYYLGENANGELLMNMPNGLLKSTASILLFIHVLVVFLVRSVVLSKYIMQRVWLVPPSKGNGFDVRYVTIALGMLVFCYFVANLIPYFDSMLGLVGGLLAGPINFILPTLFFLSGFLVHQSSGNMSTIYTLLWRVPLKHILGCAFVITFILMTMFIGTYGVTLNISKNYGAYGGPFACKALVFDKNESSLPFGCR